MTSSFATCRARERTMMWTNELSRSFATFGLFATTRRASTQHVLHRSTHIPILSTRYVYIRSFEVNMTYSGCLLVIIFIIF